MDFEFFAGDLSLDFINTLAPGAEPATLHDSLESYGDLIEWATKAGLVGATQNPPPMALNLRDPQGAETLFRQAIELRDSLYHLVLALVEGRSPSPEDLRRFNTVLTDAQAHVQLCMSPEGYRFQLLNDPKPGSLLWPIASAASRLLTSTDAGHIRRCAAETCLGFFIDRSKNHSRRWCDMKVCGNRSKVRQHYAQQKKTRTAEGERE